MDIQRYIFNSKYISEAEYISGAACAAWLLAGEVTGVCIYVRAQLSALWSGARAGASPL